MIAIARHHPRITPEAFKHEVFRWAVRVGATPSGVYVQRMTTKWGSCSRTGRLYFSTDLLVESKDFQELVIVHELLHLQVPNHGKLFKSLLGSFLPNWQRTAAATGRSVCGNRLAE